MSRRFRVESQDPGSRLLGRMLPSVSPGDELVLVGRFGSFIVPAGVAVFAAGATVERAEISDGEVTGGAWARLRVTGRAVLRDVVVEVLVHAAGDLDLQGTVVLSGSSAGRLVARGCALNVTVDGVAELDDVRGELVVNGTARGTRARGALTCAGRVQLEGFTGALHVTGGTVEIAEVDLDGGDGPALTQRGGAVFLDAGRLRGAVDATGGELVIGAQVQRG